MLIIKTKLNNYEFKYDGLKIFEFSNTTKLFKELFYDSEIVIDNKLIKKDNIVYINELTKISDLIDLSKKSTIMHLILEEVNNNTILNLDNINNITNKINTIMEYEILENKESDIMKIINLVFELIDDQFLNIEIFRVILEKIFTEEKLIIFDNVSWLKLSILKKYLNNHNFIILTNDIRNSLDSIEYLECYVNENLNEFIDTDILINYIQQQINDYNISSQSLEIFLNNKNDFISYKIHQILKKI